MKARWPQILYFLLQRGPKLPLEKKVDLVSVQLSAQVERVSVSHSRGGTDPDFFRGWWFQMPFAILKMKIIFKIFKIDF